MVVDLLNSDPQADRVFHALADATRRDLLRQAMTGQHSVSALARLYPMSITAVQKHVAVLEDAGLVRRHKRGREQRVQTQIDTVKAARRYLDQVEHLWRGRIDQMDQILEEGA